MTYSKRPLKLLCLAGFLLSIGWSSNAAAQRRTTDVNNEPVRAQTYVIVGVLSVSSTTTIASWVYQAIYDPEGFMITSANKMVTSFSSTLEAMSRSGMNQAFVSRNAQRLQADITLGAGQTLTDLATLYRVPTQDVSVFQRALRKNRSALIPILSNQDDPHMGRAFALAVLSSLKQSTSLTHLF